MSFNTNFSDNINNNIINAFATELLAPIALLKNIHCLSPAMIQAMCNVSEEASMYIFDNVKKFGHRDVYANVEYLFFERFFDFVMDVSFGVQY
ncbi:MAG: hypothetical protein KatS3mg079_451 [Caloramator sp.]|uniref:Uncharacterized protein n=1 Tax=Caloramator proteoclasticus DSM 10124 TaxID=1121262 RepID=A0A1M5BGZ9_9CLOT|nr:MAG: hypothetical protein KatS3mg079_451 [Caloramator sp.]SHF41873.1 hypothetical protein SAMN02746091_02484 [Caloramator proteoclasticus DSM 10124]